MIRFSDLIENSKNISSSSSSSSLNESREGLVDIFRYLLSDYKGDFLEITNNDIKLGKMPTFYGSGFGNKKTIATFSQKGLIAKFDNETVSVRIPSERESFIKIVEFLTQEKEITFEIINCQDRDECYNILFNEIYNKYIFKAAETIKDELKYSKNAQKFRDSLKDYMKFEKLLEKIY